MMEKYTVDFVGFSWGTWKNFWFYKHAVEYARRNVGQWPWVKIINNWTKEETWIKKSDINDYYRTSLGEYKLRAKKK
jgi:hypothetical protein